MESRRTRRVVLISGLGVAASLILALLFRHYVIEEHLWPPGSRSERLNVLYLEGTPRWDYRYLSNELLRDERVAAQVLLWGGAELLDEQIDEDRSPL